MSIFNKLRISHLIDPQEKQALSKQEELSPGLYSQNLSIEDIRKVYENERQYWNQNLPLVKYIEEKSIKTRYNNVKVYLFSNIKEKSPAIIFIHGGGFILGSTNTHRSIIHRLCNLSGYKVISIDYSLAPEAKFPQQLEECMDVILDIKNNSTKWNIDPKQISFCGDSAGAALSLGLFLKLRDENILDERLNIKSLLLAYGTYGLRDSMTRRLYGNELDGLTEEELDKYFKLYLNDQEEAKNPYIDLLSADLKNKIPPTYIVGAELDPLLDDSRALYTILKSNGINCEIEIANGVLHAFWQHSLMVDKAEKSIKMAVEFLKNI